MPDRFPAGGMAFGATVDEAATNCREVISEAWSRFTGQPESKTVSANWRAPGLFGLIARRRAHLFKLPQADPVLPAEMGEYPHYQSDTLRQKHGEFVSRMLENRFKMVATPQPGGEKARELADRAEWVLTYGAASIQERTGVDWQKALAEGASAYCYGVLHWRIAPELQPGTPDSEYLDSLPDDEQEAVKYAPTDETVGGDKTKGKFREKQSSVAARAALAKSRAPFPFHVEVVAPDQVAFIDDESMEPGPGLAVHIKEVGIIDYNGKLRKDGLRLTPDARSGVITLSLEELAEGSGVEMERPAPSGLMQPSISGWKQRIAVAYVWTREECYELASAQLMTGASETIVNQSQWLLVKGYPHGYGRVPFVRAYGTVEENEWDPALRYRPACDGLYQTKAQLDYTRAMHDRIATSEAVQRYFITQDPNAPPTLAGDEEGDQVILTRDSTQAQVLPPGQDLKPVGTTEMSPALMKLLEIQIADHKDAAPATGQSDISATTQPWTVRLGQAQANAYPVSILQNLVNPLQEMFRNWIDVAAKPAEQYGLGQPLYAPGFIKNDDGSKSINRSLPPVGMEPDDWNGIWLDVEISPTSAAERVTELQLGLQILNNPIRVTTPEMFVGDSMGVSDATGHMQEVEADQAIRPYMAGLVSQKLAEYFGKKVLVGADGTMVNSQGQPVQPSDVLAMQGVKPVQPAGTPGSAPQTAPQPPVAPGVPSMAGSAAMPSLPGLSVNGAAPLPGTA